MNACNSDNRDGRCNANDGEPCDECAAKFKADEAYFRALYDVAPLSERDPKRYRAEMVEAGRGHLLREEE